MPRDYCLSLYLSVTNVTGKVANAFGCVPVTQERTDQRLVMTRTRIQILDRINFQTW